MALFSIIAGSSSALAVTNEIDFLGGNLDVEGNWDGGAFPADGETGLVELDATWPNTSGAGTLSVTGDLIIGSTTATNITLTAATDIVGANPSSVVFNNVTVNVNDDIFTGGATGNFIFNPGSVTMVADDFEANGGGTITINGGTHTLAGTVNTSNFGAQNNSTLNFFGGTVVTDVIRTTQNGPGTQFGTINIGGDAMLTADSIELADNGVLEFSSNWNGSLEVASVTDWQATLITAGATLDGVAIDATSFANTFVVSNGGNTITGTGSGVVDGGGSDANLLILEITQVGSNLNFQWLSTSGMQYDLVSTTDLTSAQDPLLLPPYNDGVTTFEAIESTGTGPQTLTAVQLVGPRRFFILIERPI